MNIRDETSKAFDNNLDLISNSYQQISNEQRLSLSRLINNQGKTIKDAAEILQLNYNTAKTIMRRYKVHDVLQKLPKGGKERNILTEEVVQKIEEIVSFNPLITLKGIKQSLESNMNENFTISIPTIHRCLEELKITFKLTHRELDRVNSADKIALRKEYSLWYNNFFLNDFSKAIFIDETSYNNHLRRSQGRSPSGTRVNIRVPTLRGRSISLLASMSINGMCHCKVISNSTVNGDIFAIYIEELCIYLRDVLRMESACLILDNARIHRRADLERITSQFNYNFKFLSPYSYMLNPIESSFSKIKSGIKNRLGAGESGILSEMILTETRNVDVADCNGYFRNVQRNITNCAAGLPFNHQ